MVISGTGRIHPTAIISPEAELADGVEIGAFCIIEGSVKVGPECILRPGAMLYGPMTLGRGNVVHSGAILGDSPQHLKYQNEPTTLEIGDANIFREHVTVHRGTEHSWTTKIGSHNFFMANSHVGHDSIVGDRCIIANNALIAGHCVLENSVYLSGNTAVHQFVRMGRLSLLGGLSATSKDIPPFVMQQGLNNVVGMNLVGMRRAGMTPTQINAVKDAFRILFREGLGMPIAIAKLEKELGTVDAVQDLITFLQKSERGINAMHDRRLADAA